MILIVLIYCWTYLSLTLHELSHFFAAKKLGMDVASVTIGTGPVLLRLRIKGVSFNFNLLPNGGLTRAAHHSLWRMRRTQLVLYAAGPAANMLLCVIAGLILLTPSLQQQFQTVLVVILLIEIWMVVSNVLPRMAKVGTERLPSDGKVFFEALGKTQHTIENEFLTMLKTAIEPYIRKGTAADSARIPFGGDPENIDLFLRAGMALWLVDYKKAEKTLEMLAQKSSLNDAEHACIYDYLASLTTIYGQNNYLNQSRNWVELALHLAPDCETLKATKGALMVECGNLAKGSELLLPFIEPNTRDTDREISAAYLSKAEFLRGNLAQAAAYLEIAESIGLVKIVTDRIKRETTGMLKNNCTLIS